MSKYDIGPKIGIEGESEFKRAIENVNRNIKTLGTEMKVAASAYKEGDKSAAALTSQNEVLTKQIVQQKEKLALLSNGLEKSNEKYGEADKATQGLKQSVNVATAELNKLERQLKENTSTIDAGTSAAKKYEDQMKKFKDIGKSLTDVGKTMSIAITAPIIAAFAASFKLASDVDESMNKVDVAFEQSAEVVKKWSQTSLESIGMAQGSALDAAATYGDMGTSMGIATRDAAKMATSLVDLAADLASFKNISIDQAMTALRGVFTGEGESLKTLGIIMQESTLKAFALTSGTKKTYEEMSQAEKVALRYAYVMSVTTNAQGDFVRTSDGAANQMRTFKEAIKELGASFGEVLLPAITPMISGINDIIIGFGNLSPETKAIIIGVAGVAAAIGPVLLVGGKLLTVVGTFSGALALVNGGTVLVTPAIAGLAKLMTIFSGATAASTGATVAHTVATTAGTIATKLAAVAQGIFNAVMTANPIILVVGGLVALGAALYVIIKHWKEIVEWLKKAWEWLNKWNAIDVKDKAVINNPRVTGYAEGTQSALPGWHWTGENGPELIKFRGGESVMNAERSARAIATSSVLAPQGAANQTHQYVLNITLRTEAREIAKDVFEFFEERNMLLGTNLLQEG